MLFRISRMILHQPSGALAASKPGDGHWVDIWTTMPQLTESTNLPNPPFNGTTGVFRNATIRQTLHMGLNASFIRLRISNAFGTSNLGVTAVTLAKPSPPVSGASAIDTSTLQNLTFSGSSSFSIPDGALLVSDAIEFAVHAGDTISVSMFLADGQDGFDITSHPGSRATSWMAPGDVTKVENLTGSSVQNVARWYFLSAVEAWVPKTSRSFAVVGDSITDGRGSDTDGNDRWPDLVQDRLRARASTADIAVVNQAAGGNRILADGLGPNALGRIDRDVLAHSSVRYAMIFEGVNDIGVAATDNASQTAIGDELLIAFRQISVRVHAVGIPLFAATITPFGGNSPSYADPTRELTRQRVNTFIRSSSAFDAVVDFDKVVADPADPTRLAPQFDSGDGLHPNVAGYTAMAAVFDLSLFKKFEDGVSVFV
ncbi:SGNH hydrolase [Vararia minispora EC-137]|uniref:SGNH hydrolase n=1 Tax=Vararia minispora EC-137 TaxID=1314806 RepID=A0ACB8QBE4_9AGAM|nr:SGNH hydrolase [Vararia minispora EC-137]